MTFPFAFLYWVTCRCKHKHIKTVWPIPYNYLYTGSEAVDVHLDFRTISYSVKISAKLLKGIFYLVYLYAERSNINAEYKAEDPLPRKDTPVRLHYAQPSNGTGREPRSGHGCNRHHVNRFRRVAKQEGVSACYYARSTICSKQP